MKKSLVFILVIFLLFISISAVSANDNIVSNDTFDDIVSSDTNFINEMESIDDLIINDSSNEILEDSLNNSLNNSVTNSNEDFNINNDLNSFTNNKSISKSKIATQIKINKITAYNKEKTTLNIYLKDKNNTPLENKTLKIVLNGKTYSKITNKLGNIQLNLNLKVGSYNAKVYFIGGDDYESSNSASKITIKKNCLSIIAKNYSTYLDSDLFFSVKVINNFTKNPVSGIKVKFNVYSSQTKYKNYYAYTNKKGIAYLDKNLKVASYDVYIYIKENDTELTYKNSKVPVILKIKPTCEVGCASVIVRVNENQSVLAFRRDSSYAANLHIVAGKWYGRTAIKQYKLKNSKVFHCIVTSDGWFIGTGGQDITTINKKIESLAGQMVKSNSISDSKLKTMKKYQSSLSLGHFLIVAPDGRYGIVWKNKILKGNLKNGEYLAVPNLKSYFKKGTYKKFSSNPLTAAIKIDATGLYGYKRRNIMSYHYMRTAKDYKINSTVKVYGSNDIGNYAGLNTKQLRDNVYYRGKFVSKYTLVSTPNKTLLGTYKFGNIDKLIKTQTVVTANNLTADIGEIKYFNVKVVNKNTKKAISGVKINLKLYTDGNVKNYVITTNKSGIAMFNPCKLEVGIHKVVISSANYKYIISATRYITIKQLNITLVEEPIYLEL